MNTPQKQHKWKCPNKLGPDTASEGGGALDLVQSKYFLKLCTKYIEKLVIVNIRLLICFKVKWSILCCFAAVSPLNNYMTMTHMMT